MFSGFFIALFLLRAQNVLCSSQPEVVLSQGPLKGLYTKTVGGRDFSSFLGIPYAKPPIGDERFQEAELAGPWIGTYNATIPPPGCVQLDHFNFKTQFSVHGSENCLFINVFTPKVPNDKSKEKLLDVIAFIHGGAFMFMSSTFFGPEILLDRDIVFVTFNYRLGPLGFLTTEDEVAPGNNGLKDQVLALEWIQKNIGAFGGNPNSVTLAGISAGSASAHYHLLSPLSKGLFHRAILMSGTSLNPWTQAENVKEKSQYIAKELGCPTDDTLRMVRCLKERPAEHIVGLSKKFLKWLFNPFSPFGPTVEPACHKSFICEQPIDILKKGLATDVPILASYAADEGIYPGAEIILEPNLKVLNEKWDELIPHILDYNYTVLPATRIQVGQKIKDHYKIDLNSPEGTANLIKMIGDRLFVHDILKAVNIHGSQNKSPVYLYRFSYKGKYSGTSFFNKKDLGVSHGDDLFYILSSKAVNTQETDEDKQMSKKMVDLWITFASNGSLPEPWTPVNNKFPSIPLMDIKGANDIEYDTINRDDEDYFWDSLGLNENIEHGNCSPKTCSEEKTDD